MRILIILLLICIEQKAFAQTNIYHPFPDSNAMWRVNQIDYSYPAPPYYALNYYQYTISGDSLIGNTNWKKLWISGVFYANVPGTMYYNGLSNLIRQDTLLKTIYIYHGSGNNDTILYDFNIQLGDTIPETWFMRAPTWYHYHVTNVDSILIGSDYRKRWEISDSVGFYQLFLVEGIGSLLGPVESWELQEQIYYLACYKEDNILLFSDGSSFSCDSIDLTPEIFSLPSSEITLFPNPSNGTFFIHQFTSRRSEYITIIDPLGRKVPSEITPLAGDLYKVQITSNISGLYAVIFQNSNFYSLKKILVTL